MGYKLIITKVAEIQLDNLINYLLFEFQNESAAKNLLNSIEKIYLRIEENPYQFPVCNNPLLTQTKYREATLTSMNYVVIFRIQTECIYVMGVFHQRENYHVHLLLD